MQGEWTDLLQRHSICNFCKICERIRFKERFCVPLVKIAVPMCPYPYHVHAISFHIPGYERPMSRIWPYSRPYPSHILAISWDMAAHILVYGPPISRIYISSHIIFDILDMGEDMGVPISQDMQLFSDVGNALMRTRSEHDSRNSGSQLCISQTSRIHPIVVLRI